MKIPFQRWQRRRVSLLAPYLHHSTVEVDWSRVKATRAFYEELIGLHQINSPVEKSIWFAEGVHLYWGGSGIYKDVNHALPSAHIAIVLGERYATVRQTCIRWKVHIVDGTPYWNSPRCYVTDPSHNRVELMEFPP